MKALDLLALALKANNIKFVQLIGGKMAVRKAVADFRDNEEVKVGGRCWGGAELWRCEQGAHKGKHINSCK
jgi:hypothetical protein